MIGREFQGEPQVDFIAVDWGTSSFRAYLVHSGEIVDEVSGPHGILSVEPGGHAAVLRDQTGRWREGAPLPTVLSGMIGSRQGWREAAYDAIPTSVDEIAANVMRWSEPGVGDILLIPGILQAEGVIPDVMRGEETQIFGALHLMGLSDAVCIMPGTHSKRVEVRGGRIMAFQTFMTGEVFAALKGHTILGRLMAEGVSDGSGFARGLDVAAGLEGPGALLHAVFGARTLGLTGGLAAAELAEFLSGVLIGAELRQAVPEPGGRAVVIGSAALQARYASAAERLGVTLMPAPDRCVVAGQGLILAAAETRA